MAAHSTRRGRTDWGRLERVRDADIRKAAKADLDAAPIAPAEWFRRAKLFGPRPKVPVSMRLDEDVVKWFRARGRGTRRASMPSSALISSPVHHDRQRSNSVASGFP